MAVSNLNSIVEGSTKPGEKRDLINKNGILNKDAFLKLLLEQLKHQDPTSPMETDKMLSQAADLTVVESQQNIAKALEKMSSKLAAASDYNLVSAVGKMADTGKDRITVSGSNERHNFSLYFPKDYKAGTVTIKDSNGRIVHTQTFKEGKEGTKDFSWDGKTPDGKRAENGTYTVSATYTTQGGQKHTIKMGMYKIQAVRFGTEGVQFKMGGKYYPHSEIREIQEQA